MDGHTPLVGYHASHEQFPPSKLIGLVIKAEAAGFNALLSSDHFNPWSHRQGQSGHAWSWMGAALQATMLPLGVVSTPGQRYHPAIIAQGIATLSEMFPGRFWIALGSGQRLNESIVGERWPIKEDRQERLLESAEVIRRLLRGEKVTHRGLIAVEEAELFTRPSKSPQIFGAALSARTAGWVASWADGLITINKPKREMKEMVEAFRRGGGEGKPMYLKVQVSYAESDDKALEGAWDQWKNAIFPSSVSTEIGKPEDFDAASTFVRREDLRDFVRVSSDPDEHIEWLRGDLEMGFERLYLHNVNREQDMFIKDFGERVLPALLR